MRGVRVLRARCARALHVGRATESLALCFALVPDLLLDCSRVLEYAKIRTVLESNLQARSRTTKGYYSVCGQSRT